MKAGEKKKPSNSFFDPISKLLKIIIKKRTRCADYDSFFTFNHIDSLPLRVFFSLVPSLVYR